MSEYIIKKVGCRKCFADYTKNGENLPISVTTTPWGGYAPKVYAALAHDDENLYVCMRAYEFPFRAEVKEHDGMVHTDSCMEFFFSPNPEKPDYFNMEMNPLGMLKLHYGPGRKPRFKTVTDPSIFEVVPTSGDGWWQLEYKIPYSHIKASCPEFTGKSGSAIKMNMYKCGELTAQSHFVTCFPIDTNAYPKPDFHRPEYFQEVIFE